VSSSRWSHVCALEDIYPGGGVGALVDGCQIAVFRIGDALHAIGNHDPASGTNVLARGIVGDLDGELMVASPMYKQHFSLTTGRCLEDASLSVPVYPVRINDQQVWLRTEPAANVRTGPRSLVVIGNGPAAMRTLEELIELAPRDYAVTVFGGEPTDTYNRVMLSSVLAGERSPEQTVTHPPQWFEEQGIALHTADPIVEIDRLRRRVRSLKGIEVGYDRLLIATGSVPKTLNVPGQDLPGVKTLREMCDVQTILAAASASDAAVVIGGGVLGLEAANAMARLGTRVTVVHDQPVLMNRQLDAAAGELLRSQLEDLGLSFCLPAHTVALHGAGRVSGVELADGRRIAADLVVIAIGVRPNVELAQAAGLHCEQGLWVDDTMMTFDPAIYAVGECIQHRGRTYGLAAPLWDQARVCAAHLAERGVRRYRGSRVSTQLRIGEIDVFTAGDCAGVAGAESLVLRDPKRRIYRRLVIENDRVRGALLYGDTRDGHWYLDLIREGRPIGPLRDRLMFGEASG
jgi:nitrite reductase (NADH) large subunit